MIPTCSPPGSVLQLAFCLELGFLGLTTILNAIINVRFSSTGNSNWRRRVTNYANIEQPAQRNGVTTQYSYLYDKSNFLHSK